MGERSAEERLAAHLKLGIEALRAERPDAAVLHLRPVVDDPALASSGDLVDVRTRALSLLAQALLDMGDHQALDEVERRLDESESIDPDPNPSADRATLRDRLADARRQAMEQAARDARTERLAEADIEPWLERITDPDRRCDLLVQKAQAELTHGRLEAGRELARRAREMAEHVTLRPHVMALLTMARAFPEEAAHYLDEALGLADRASEPTLVGTIVKTAGLLGVPLPVQTGPVPVEPR